MLGHEYVGVGGSSGKKCSISFSEVMRLKGKERDEPSQRDALPRGWGGRPDVDIFHTVWRGN